VLYASRETHSSVIKAVELLGLGRAALRLLPVDADFRLDLAALEAAVAGDRVNGRAPFCVVANAGSVNTGAIDDLERVADVARREQLWLHVDGAFGAFAALAPSLRGRLAGMERADSLAFDLHKWGHFPIEAGCLLVRRDEDQLESFRTSADYLTVTSGGVAGRRRRFAEYGLQLTRGFRALKVWMGLKEQGVARLGRLVEQNVAQARELAERVDREPELERLAPVPLNVVCLRYRGGERDPGRLDALNRRLLVRLQESGAAVPSHTLIGGRFAIRVCLTNHRTRREDLALLVEKLLELGRGLEAEAASGKETRE
jgi:glutamate/tyrosine decarboxylase-like PLP-dependent enzyme